MLYITPGSENTGLNVVLTPIETRIFVEVAIRAAALLVPPFFEEVGPFPRENSAGRN
jgi:hypothetical protein